VDGAIAALRQAIYLKTDYASAYLSLGTALRDKGDLDGAIAAYRAAIRLKKNYAAAHNNLGNALRVKGDVDEAITELRTAIALDPELAFDLYGNLGLALAAKGDVDGAIAAHREAIRLKKGYPEAHCNLGLALAAKGDVDGAIAAFQEAVRLKQDYAEAHYNLGLGLSKKGQFAEAIAAYREAVKFDPKDAAHHGLLGVCLATSTDLRLRDTEQSLAFARKSVELAPVHPAAWQTLGVAHYANGSYQAAIEAISRGIKLIKLHGHGDGDAESRAFFFLAMAHWQLGHKDEAGAYFHKAVRWMDQHQPKDAELDRFRAEAAALLGIADEPRVPGKKEPAPLP
jgi:tetratricopeptide (TPR) repeat protein